MTYTTIDIRYSPRTCPGCGGEVTGSYRRKYCSPACQRKASRHGARTARRAAYVQGFVGVDGEGVNLPSGEHRYVMLSVGDETLWKNGEALTHHDIFPFLYSCFQNNDRRLAYVGFYLGYDFTHWLKLLSKHEATMLFTPAGIAVRKRKTSPMPFPVYIPGWEIDLLGMKRFKLRPHVHNSRKNRCACGYESVTMPTKNEHDWMVVCDTGSFFQTAFVNVLDPKGWRGEAPCTAAEYETILAGKSSRANTVDLDDLSWLEPMMEYNRLENRSLAEVMRIYNDGFKTMGVTLNRTQFFGPGQAAQQWLSARAKEGRFITHDQIAETVPLWVIDLWRQTYYGGRFEIFYHGIVSGTVYEYDIQSAYPDAIRRLPCLCRTQSWNRERGPKTIEGVARYLTGAQSRLTIVLATVEAANPRIGPIPHRTRDGAIVYPGITKGWYRLTELQTAKAVGLIAECVIHEYVYPTTLCQHDPPLASLAKLFEERLRVGKTTPHGKALKLVYNSVYGKFAQSVGEPRYANSIYASMITSDCRIRILESMTGNLDELVMIATDGVYYAAPRKGMPTVETNVEALGEWECATKHNLTLFKPGVYWDDSARTAIAEGKTAKLKARGISARALQEHILNIDEEFQGITAGRVHKLPEIELRVPFSIVSPRLALARGKWETAGKVEYDMIRYDRAAVRPKRTGVRPVAPGLLISSSPTVSPTETTPYERTFGFDLADGSVDDEMITPDGLAIETVQVAIHDLIL